MMDKNISEITERSKKKRLNDKNLLVVLQTHVNFVFAFRYIYYLFILIIF